MKFEIKTSKITTDTNTFTIDANSIEEAKYKVNKMKSENKDFDDFEIADITPHLYRAYFTVYANSGSFYFSKDVESPLLDNCWKVMDTMPPIKKKEMLEILKKRFEMLENEIKSYSDDYDFKNWLELNDAEKLY